MGLENEQEAQSKQIWPLTPCVGRGPEPTGAHHAGGTEMGAHVNVPEKPEACPRAAGAGEGLQGGCASGPVG